MATDFNAENEVDLASRLNGLGELSQAFRNMLIGFNHRGFGSPVPSNTENYGLTFFTRPRMNLSYDNIVLDRNLTPLAVGDGQVGSMEGQSGRNTYQRVIRMMLDPITAKGRVVRRPGYSTNGHHTYAALESDLFDKRQAFMPMLTNLLLSVSGFPDPAMAYYVSKPGVQKEVWAMADDVVRDFRQFELQLNFRNIEGDPITLLFEVWRRYMGNVYQGLMSPYMDSVIESEIDYQTAIYRFTLCKRRRFIQKFGRTIGFPVSSALGASLDYNSDSPFNQQVSQQISIPFACVGMEYNDPILLNEFNTSVWVHNPDMMDGYRERSMIQINPDYMKYFNYMGFPLINTYTNELTWWVYKKEWEQMRANFPVIATPPQGV